jgi:hypothetical protein
MKGGMWDVGRFDVRQQIDPVSCTLPSTRSVQPLHPALRPEAAARSEGAPHAVVNSSLALKRRSSQPLSVCIRVHQWLKNSCGATRLTQRNTIAYHRLSRPPRDADAGTGASSATR